MIPIYRAKKKDDGETVEGFLIELWALIGRRFAIDMAMTFDNEENSLDVYEIDQSTLQMSFDGENFLPIPYIWMCIKQTEKIDSRSCDNCLYYSNDNRNYYECEVFDKDMGADHYCSLWKEVTGLQK